MKYVRGWVLLGLPVFLPASIMNLRTHNTQLELSTAQQEQEAKEEEEDVNRTEYIWDVVNVSHLMYIYIKMMLRETFGTSTAAGAKPKQNHWENGRVWKETEIQRVTEKDGKIGENVRRRERVWES